MKNKIAFAGLMIAIIFYSYSLNLVEKAEYKNFISFSSDSKSEDSFAEVIKLRENNSRWHEVWHVLINKLNFVSTVYISGGNIKGVSVFKSTGHFELSNSKNISIRYQTQQRTPEDIESDILTSPKIKTYIAQAGRSGIENHNSIRTIYNDPNMKIIRRDQSDEFIMYSHSASK